jgi:hypothetical protein
MPWRGPRNGVGDVHNISTSRDAATAPQNLEQFLVARAPFWLHLRRMTIFHLRRAYHDSLSNMRGWLLDTSFSERLTVLDRLSIIDAWQQEMVEFFTKNGYCFVCNRRVSRCTCPHEQQ